MTLQAAQLPMLKVAGIKWSAIVAVVTMVRIASLPGMG